MNKGLWTAQIVGAIFFVYTGILHFIVPEGLPGPFEWMYDLSETMHFITGAAEILGGLGLVLPAVTRIQPKLVALAAGGLALLMVGAVVYHIGRGEYSNVGSNVVWILVMAFVAYGRGKALPIEPRSEASPA